MPIAFELLTVKIKENGKDQLLKADIADKDFINKFNEAFKIKSCSDPCYISIYKDLLSREKVRQWGIL